MSLSVDIRKRLGDFSLDVSFKAENPAETLALLGASGCGKSMALKCVAGVERPDEGRIVLNGRVLYDSAARVNVPAQRRRVGYLVQSYALFPTMTVLDNVLELYLNNTVYAVMLEARVGEHAARMTAMTAATDSTAELIEDLNLEFNRARQAAITTEISEIVGGSAALKKSDKSD